MSIRFAVLVLAGAVTAWPQLVSRPAWNCNAKDRKSIVTPCDACKTYYCWDGQIFSDTKGYTPPPPHVLQHFERNKSDSARSSVARSERVGQERGSAERIRQSPEFNEALRRKIADHAGGPPLNRVASRSASPALRTQVARPAARYAPPASAHPSMTALGAVPAAPPPAPPIPSAKMDGIAAGLDRAAVLAKLGKPHGSLVIPDGDGGVEVLSYTLQDNFWAKVRLEKGRVVSVQKNE